MDLHIAHMLLVNTAIIISFFFISEQFYNGTSSHTTSVKNKIRAGIATGFTAVFMMEFTLITEPFTITLYHIPILIIVIFVSPLTMWTSVTVLIAARLIIHGFTNNGIEPSVVIILLALIFHLVYWKVRSPWKSWFTSTTITAGFMTIGMSMKFGTADHLPYFILFSFAYYAVGAIACYLILYIRQNKERLRAIERQTYELMLYNEKFQTLVENVREVIFQTDAQGNWTFLSKAWTDMTGFQIEESLGKPCSAHLPLADWKTNETMFALLLERKEEYCQREVCYITKDGSERWGDVFAKPLLDHEGRIIGTAGTLHDITYRKEYEQKLQEANDKLQHLAGLDGLTGIPNRRTLDERMETEWLHAISLKLPISFILLDIDNFKAYNDHYGHSEGDACLRAVAEAIPQHLRKKTDLVARYGGEEFAVLLPDTDEVHAIGIAERICTAIAELRIPHTYSNEKPYVTGSFGVSSCYPSPLYHWQELIVTANTALYQAKMPGKNGLHYQAFHSSKYAQESRAAMNYIECLYDEHPEVWQHCRRVAQLAKITAETMGHSLLQCHQAFVAGLLHDIGKLRIPDSILYKPTRLTTDEFLIMKEHSAYSYNMLVENGDWSPEWDEVLTAILQHHERPDGNGYPNGLYKEQILELTSIISICDAFDAMTEQRVYKERTSWQEALQEIAAHQGTQFDGHVVEHFLSIWNDPQFVNRLEHWKPVHHRAIS